MFIISISIHTEKIANDQADSLLKQHRAWYAKYFEASDFVMIGPYKDQAHAGVIIADVADRATLDKMLAEDSYYPALADYSVREFDAKLSKLPSKQ